MIKTFGHLVFTDDKPVWTLQRQPFPEKKQSRYEIWVDDDGISITPVQLAQLLADTMQNVVTPAPKRKIGESK